MTGYSYFLEKNCINYEITIYISKKYIVIGRLKR